LILTWISTSLTSNSLKYCVLLDESANKDWEVDDIDSFKYIDISATYGRQTSFVRVVTID